MRASIISSHVPRMKMVSGNVRPVTLIKSSKTPQELNYLMRDAIQQANAACNDPDTHDLDCMLQWDAVDEITKAYNKAVDELANKNVVSVEPKVLIVPRLHKKKPSAK